MVVVGVDKVLKCSVEVICSDLEVIWFKVERGRSTGYGLISGGWVGG